MSTVKEPLTGPRPASFFKSVISQLKPQRHSEAPANKPSDTLKSNNRCQFTFADGRQCKMSSAQLCAHHSSKQHRGAKRVSDASALEALCSDLTTTTSINRALAQTFLLMAQGRISRKDAVAFGYLSQLLLQSVSGVRAEYVAAFGYRQWENKLKASLTPNADDDPEPSPGGDSGPSGGGGENLEQRRNGVVERQKGMSIRPLLPHKEAERPLAERIMGEPDYADILSRSLDMLDRKYDTTPEGRCEAKKLALELELMKPAPAKPTKDFFGQTVALVRRCRDAEQQNSDAASISPALDYYGHPIKTHAVPPPWADKQDALPPARGTATPGCAHPTPSASRSELPTAPDPQTSSSGLGAFVAPPSRRHRSCAPSASDPADFVAPPSRRHLKHRSHSSPPVCAPHSDLPLPLPICATTVKPDSVGGPDDEHHEGHRADWYAPPLWSKTGPPDPFPSRKEKLQRKIRGLTNSAFRRLQHQNSRGFWNKGLQKLTP
jgi:hypothetical protein